MKSVRRAVVLETRPLATRTPAVTLTSVARFADREWHPAPAAQQQVQNDLRRQSLAHAIEPRAEWTDERGGVILLPLTSSRPAPAALHRRGLFLRGRDDTPHRRTEHSHAGRGFAADDDGVVRPSTARQESAVPDRRSQNAGSSGSARTSRLPVTTTERSVRNTTRLMTRCLAAARTAAVATQCNP